MNTILIPNTIALKVIIKLMHRNTQTQGVLTLYVAHSVSLLKASVAMTRCNSFMWVAPHGARYFLAYVIALKLFSALTNSMNS